jgi:hypothetical protein
VRKIAGRRSLRAMPHLFAQFFELMFPNLLFSFFDYATHVSGVTVPFNGLGQHQSVPSAIFRMPESELLSHPGITGNKKRIFFGKMR